MGTSGAIVAVARDAIGADRVEHDQDDVGPFGGARNARARSDPERDGGQRPES